MQALTVLTQPLGGKPDGKAPEHYCQHSHSFIYLWSHDGAHTHIHTYTVHVQPSWTSLEAVKDWLSCSQANPLKISESPETHAGAKAWGHTRQVCESQNEEEGAHG